MSSISAGSLQRPSPKDFLQKELTNSIQSGKVNAADKDALSTAIDSIDDSLQSQRASGGVGGGKRPSKDELQAKVSSLIDDQVKSGTLTEDQASELKDVFKSTFEKGPGHARGAGGPPPGPPPDDADSTSGTSSKSDDITKLIEDFLKSVKDQTSASYSTSGTKTASNSNASLLLDLTA